MMPSAGFKREILMNNEEFKEEGGTPVDDGTQQPESQEPTPKDEPKPEKEKGDSDYKSNKELSQKAYQERQNKRKEKEASIDEIIEQKVAERLSEVESRLNAEKETEFINSISSSQEEADKIREALNDRVKRSGNLSEDIQLAKLIANRENIENLQKEESSMKKGRRMGSFSSPASMEGSDTPQYSDREKALLASFNIDPKTGKYIK